MTLAFLVRREIAPGYAALYVLCQVAGAVAGALIAHAMFELAILQFSAHARSGSAQFLSEAVATFGLVGTIFAGLRWRPEGVPWLVGLYITAPYWFTASTSFANPAVTFARMLTDTFSGIRPVDVPAFVVAQCLGALLAAAALGWLLHARGQLEEAA